MQNRKGFTLIELLIVVVIIGILAAIAIPKFANTKEKAVLAGMKSDLRNLVTAQEAFFSDNQTYATGLAATQGASHGGLRPDHEQRDHPVDRDRGRLGGASDQCHAQGHHHQVRYLCRQRYCAERCREGRGRPGLLLRAEGPPSPFSPSFPSCLQKDDAARTNGSRSFFVSSDRSRPRLPVLQYTSRLRPTVLAP